MGFGKKAFAALLLLVFASVLAAQPSGSEANISAYLASNTSSYSGNSSILGDLGQRYTSDPEFKTQVDAAIGEFKNRTGGNITYANLDKMVLVVVGSDLSAVETSAMDAVVGQLPAFQNVTKIQDTDPGFSTLAKGKILIILVGGPSQNRITKQLQDKGLLEPQLQEFYGQAIVNYGKTPDGIMVMVISHARGYKNEEESGVAYSPLNGLIPEKYVPAAATGIAVSLLALPSILSALFALLPGYVRSFLGKYLQFLGKQGKEIKEKFIGFSVFGFQFKLREVLSIILAASIFGTAMAYIFTGPKPAFVQIALLNLLIAAFLYFAREIARLIISYFGRYSSEFQFWPLGSLITLLSAFLGNTCNATYYILEGKDEKGVMKSALIKIFVEIATIGVAAVFFTINLLAADRLWQMFFVSASTLGLIESLPITPLPGSGIWKWKKLAWLLTFLVVGGGYVLMNFVL